MLNDFQVKLPFFEIGPKAYMYGEDALRLAQHADRLARELDIGMIFTPQTVDLQKIAENTQSILVFAQHMDSLRPGRGMGSVLPEALNAAGAKGTFLNHAERKLTLDQIHSGIQRANEVGLAALVCVDNLPEAKAVAHFQPDILIVEAEANIGRDQSIVDTEMVRQAVNSIATISAQTRVLISAGIKTPEDVRSVILSGGVATGCTSAIMCSEDPFVQTEKMLRALRDAWDKVH